MDTGRELAAPGLSSARDQRRPRGGGRRDTQRHACLGRRTVTLALVAAATGGHGVEPGVAATAGTGQHVVDGGGVAAAVGAAMPVADQYAGARPGGAAAVPPAGHDVVDEPYDTGHGEHAQLPVGLRLVDDGDLAAQHAYGVAYRDPVKRAQV